MGCYVNPKEDKVDWLSKNGTKEWLWIKGLKPVIKAYPDYCRDNRLPVIVCDNGPFTAAGIAFDEREWEAFTSDCDNRTRACFTVDIELLKTVSPIEDYMEK